MGRQTILRVLSALAVLATVLTAAPTYVDAAGPDSINGLLWRDLNASGQLGDTDPTQFGAGPEGPIAGATIDITGPGGSLSQTTGTDGLYSFDGLPPGAYNITITYPSGYRPGVLGPDSDITSSSAPPPGDPWTATTAVNLTAGGEIVIDGGVAPLPILSLDVADLDPGPGVTPAIETGRPNFDTLGDCLSIDNPPSPGDDCAADDGYVRTNDLTTMTFAVTADNIPDPATDPLQNVIFEQKITPSADADVAFDSLPPECLTTGVAPPSSITVDPVDGSSVLICNLGPFQNELKLVGVSIKALGSSANGSSFTTDQRVYQVEDAAIPDDPYPSITTEISAAPRFDITKGTSPENPFNRTIYGQTTQRENPSTGVTEYGVNYYYDITVLYDGSIVGQESLAGPITFSDTIDPNFDGWVMTACYNQPYTSNTRLPIDTTPEMDWGTRGDWTCTPDYVNNEIDISVDNVDTDGDPVPTLGVNGNDLSSGPFVAFAGRVYIWYPLSEFYQQSDPTWAYGDAPITGDYSLVNTVTQFNPTSSSGVSNYGPTDTEPEDNNIKTTNVPIYDRGGFSKHVGSYEWADGRVTTEFSDVSTYPCSPGRLMDGQTQVCGSGDGPIQPGQKTSWWFWFRNDGSIPWPSESLEICDAFDNSTMTLTNWSYGGYAAVRHSGIPANAIIVEYATGNFDDDVANNDWANQTAAVETCTAPLDDWTTDPTTLGIDNVGMVRIRVDETIHPEILPSQYIQTAIPTEARDTYYGGPNDGASIEPGVYLANMANRQFGATPYGTLATDTHLFRPEAYENSPWGDRLILNRHQVRIDKRTSRDALGDDLLEQVEAGEPVLWSLHPAVTAISDGAIAENVTVVDVLPQYITLDPTCQAAQPMPPGVTLTSVTPGPGTGETTLVFDLGDREVNQPIGVIPVCTVSDAFAPPSTDAVNHVEISSDGDVSPEVSRTDDRPIRIIQTGAFVVGKSVDAPLELQNSTQTWTVGWQNLSQSLPFAPPDAIDVLPYNGDFGNALNGRSEFDSVFSSSIGLTGYIGQPETNDGAGGLSVTNGTWYYSADAPAGISHDPRDASNALPSGPATTNWCTEIQLTAAVAPCDFPLQDVNAIRFVSDDNLMPNETVTVSYTTAAGLANGTETVTNEPRDRYVNRFAAFSTTFPNQLIRSQEVLVQVLSMSIGDLVFKDVNIDGVYTAGIDQPIPGVAVELYDDLGGLVDSTITDADGRYIFTELLEGQYEVIIPASELLPTGPLVDLLPTVLPTPADDDGNENVDQQARPGIAGAVTSGLVTLNPDVTDDPPIGYEPTGEDVAGVEDPLTYDNLSNLSVDLGFAGDPDIEIIKQVCLLEDTSTCDIANEAHWGENSTAATTIPFDGAWRITVNNIGNQQLTDVEVTDPLIPACDATSAEVPGFASMLPGESVSYTCTAADLAADLDNVAAVIATAPGGIQPEDDDDASIEAPDANPALEVIKYVANLDANNAPGPAFVPGAPVEWTYAVENTGNVDFNAVDIVDDNGTPADLTDDQTPTYVSGDTDDDDVLDIDETWLFSLTGTAASGQYTNLVDVTGTGTWGGETFEATDDDPANLFGAVPAITIVKSVNGQDANDVPGVALTPGDTASFSYVVTNTGNTHLTDIAVTDDQGVAVSCPGTVLAPNGGTMTCTGSATAVAGQYTNIGDVIGTPAAPDGLGGLTPLTNPDGTPFEKPVDDDPANYYGTTPAITIVKSVEGVDANSAPGVGLTPGDTADFTYVVTNTGDTVLIDIVVTDDQGVVVTCPATTLAANGGTMTCTGSATAVAGQYTNIGDVTGTPAAPDGLGGLEPLTNPDGTPVDKPVDEDPANYYGTTPAITIVKSVNGQDANAVPGVALTPGETANFTYVVTNTGDTALIDIVVTDDQGVVVTCPATTLAANGGTMTCTGSATAIAGQYTNIGDVTGTPAAPDGLGGLLPLTNPDGTPFEKPVDDDPANYYGTGPGISIVKSVEGVDANTAPGIGLVPGETADFTYVVTNTGDTVLIDIVVTDDQGVVVTCPATTLAANGGTMTCTGSATVVAGQYTNIGDVTGTPAALGPTGDLEPLTNPDGTPVDKPVDEDPANYFGTTPAITIVKSVEGEDANTAPGVSLTPGETANFTYVVTNTGNTHLTDIVVTDDQGVVVTCPGTVLAPNGGTMTCTGSATVVTDQYTNIGDVIGTPAAPDGLGGLTPLTNPDGTPFEKPVDDDPANYYGTGSAITIVKYVNGIDANEIAGVALTPGDTADFTYVVTNTGNTHLTDIAVTDDQGVVVTCPATVLAPDETMTCTGSATVVADQYTNIGDVTGTPAAPGPTGDLEPLTNPDGTPVDKPVDDDPANYYGANPGIDVTKYVAGHDANDAPGINLPVGSDVEWTYVVTNTGNTHLIDIAVTDDQGVTVTCPATSLAPGQSMTCTGSGTVTDGEYVNIGQVTGTPAMPGPDGTPVPLVDEDGNELPPLIDDDPANNFGYENGIEIIKRVFGEDAPVGEEVHIAADGVADFTYEVTNTGNTWLDDLTVTDDQGVAVSCLVSVLAPGETTLCIGQGPVEAGPYTNIGTATGTPTIDGETPVTDPDTGTPVDKPTDDDDANLFGEFPDVELVKIPCYQGRCGDDLIVPDTGIITWQITVTNTGNVALEDVEITDNRVTECDRTIDRMEPGEVVVITCEAAASVTRTNSAEVFAVPVTQIEDTVEGSPPRIVTEVSETGTATVQRPSNRTLAFTGATTGFMLAIGFWLTVGGGFLVFFSRRRQTSTSSV